MLSIKNLKASLLDGTQIRKGINRDVKPGEVHAIMGINGSGKSTLAKVISGHPAYQVDEGSVELDGKNLLELEPNERANEGFFASTQYPIEIPGVPNVEFLRMAVDSKRAYLKEGPISDEEFSKRLNDGTSRNGRPLPHTWFERRLLRWRKKTQRNSPDGNAPAEVLLP